MDGKEAEKVVTIVYNTDIMLNDEGIFLKGYIYIYIRGWCVKSRI